MDWDKFEDTLPGLFPGISDLQKEQFRALGPLYMEWNSKINVISRKDIDSLYLHHVLHSLAIAEYMKANMPETYAALTAGGQHEGAGGHAADFLDLGTGGGFPGIPLAILFPSAHFTLCDSIGKKIMVAREIASAIGLRNVTAANARAENLPGSFDFVVSRAVTSLDNFMSWIDGRFRKGILYLKGGDVAGEIASAMGRYRLPANSVHVWKIDERFHDPYFEGKLVIFIEGNKNRKK